VSVIIVFIKLHVYNSYLLLFDLERFLNDRYGPTILQLDIDD